MKSDARTRYTEKVIRDSFLSLLKEKHYSRITVKEVCEKAEINRATFYNHYKDVYDLMDHMEDALLSDVDTLIQEADFTDLSAHLTMLLSHMREEGPVWLALISENGKPEILTEIGRHITHASLPLLKANMKGKSEQEVRFLYFFIMNGSVGGMSQWLQGGCRIPEEEVAEALAEASGRCTGRKSRRWK